MNTLNDIESLIAHCHEVIIEEIIPEVDRERAETFAAELENLLNGLISYIPTLRSPFETQFRNKAINLHSLLIYLLDLLYPLLNYQKSGPEE
jgi:hypothetical protein